MSLQKDIDSLYSNTNITDSKIGLAFFDKLRTRPTFKKYSAVTLYRAYILEYIILLWDNTYYTLINTNMKNGKLRGITNNLLGNGFINSVGYSKLVELQCFLEHNYFSRYSVIRYLTQAWSNYLFNKHTHYYFMPLNRIYSDKVKKQYLEISQGLADETVYYDNLSFTDDPVTIALLNFYYYLDTDKSKDVLNTFERALSEDIDYDLKEEYKKVRATRDKSLILHYICSVGMQKQSYSVSYGDNLMLNQDVMAFTNSSIQTKANDYLSTNIPICSLPVSITLAISRVGFYHTLLRVVCEKQLGCEPITIEQLDKYKQIGIKVDSINKIKVGSSTK